MKKYFIGVIIFLFHLNIGFAQLQNLNTYLLKNLDSYQSYSACWGYTAPNGREYALLGTSTGTSFIDITDSSNIHQVDFVPGLNSSWREMKTYSHYAYIVSEAVGSKLQIVDLQSLPDSCSLVDTWGYDGYTRTHSISQSGSYLYLNGGTAAGGGLAVIDITNPVSPVQRGIWITRYVHDCRVINDTIWAANITSQKITVINAVNKDNLQEITNWNNLPNPSPHNCDLTTDHKYILVTDENQSPGKLKVWDLQDLSNITFVTSWQPTNITTSIVHNVEIYGNYAIIAYYTAGIRIVNISDPTNPTEVAWYDTYPSNNSTNFTGCWGVYKFPSGKIISSDMSNGLFVIKTNFLLTDMSNGNNTIQPHSFRLVQNYPNPFNPTTNIKFSIKENSFVKLNIFDIGGKKIANIINDRRDGGNYEINFDANRFNLSSGSYFYNLEVENKSNKYSETKKMLLVK